MMTLSPDIPWGRGRDSLGTGGFDDSRFIFDKVEEEDVDDEGDDDDGFADFDNNDEEGDSFEDKAEDKEDVNDAEMEEGAEEVVPPEG